MRLSLAGPSGVGLELRALRWLACVDPVTDASGFLERPSFDGGLGRCIGAVSCGRQHRPLRVMRRHARVPCVCACACSLWPGRAGWPPGRILVRPIFSFGRFGFLLCLAPSGLGLAPSWSFFFFSLPSSASPLCLPFSLVSGPGCPGPWRCVLFVLLASRLSALRALSLLLCYPPGCWLLPGGCLPPPPVVSQGFSCRRSVSCVFFSLVRAPIVSRFLWFPAPGALGLCAVLCVFFPPASRLSVRSLFFFSCLAVGCFLVLGAPPPPSFVSGWFRRCRSVPPPFFFLSLRAPPLSLAFPGFRPRVPSPLALCFVCFVGLPLLGSPWAFSIFCVSPGRWLLPGGCCPPFVSHGFRRFRSVLCAVCCAVLCVPGCGAALRCCALCRPVLCCCVLCCFAALGWCPCSLCRALLCSPSPWGPVLCIAVFCGVAPRCVCFVVAWWCVLLFAALLCAVCVLGCFAVRSLSSPLCAVLCFAVLVRLRCAVRVVRAVAGARCCGALPCVVLFPLVCCGAVLGLVARGCLLVPCCGALLSGFLCWWCWFVSFPCVCGAVLRCVSCCSVLVESALLSVPRAVACPCVLWCLPGRSAVWWCRFGVSWCLAVLCVVLWCPAPCAVSCGAVLPCGVVLVGCAVRLSALLVFVFPFVLFSFGKKPVLFFRAFENFLKTKN